MGSNTHSLLAGLSLGALLVSGCPIVPPVDVRGVDDHVSLFSVRVPDPDAEEDWVGPAIQAFPFEQTWRGVEPVLAGTESCLTWGIAWDESDAPADCWTVQLTDAAGTREMAPRECIAFAAGPTTFSFVEQPCEDGGAVPGDDTVVIEGRSADEVVARLVPWPEIGAPAMGPLVATDDELLAVRDAPYGPELLVAAGSAVRVRPGLFDASDGASWIAWNAGEAQVALEAVSGEAVVREAEDGTGTMTGLGIGLAGPTLRVELGTGATGEITTRISDQEWVAATLTAVDAPSAAATLDVAAAGAAGGFAARAYARTAEGDIIHGAPVRWSFHGLPMAMMEESGTREVLAGRDYVELGDSCSPPTKRVGERSGTLVATLGSLRAELPLAWTNDEPADPEEADAGWERPPECRPSGCAGCSAGGEARGTLGGLLLLVIARRRRRGRED